MSDTTATSATLAAGWPRGARALASGLAAVSLLAAAAWALGGLIPLIGAPVLALGAGLAVGQVAGAPAALRDGIDFTLKRLLRLAIILFGTTLSFMQVLQIGAASLVIILATVILALGATHGFGRWMRAPGRLTSLIGVGTAICGATAVLTVGPIIESKEEEMAFAVTTIFLFNILAVLVYPVLGHVLALPDATFGLWTGAAIHDTSSVLAASFAYSESAGQVATVVKLTRTLALVPLALAYALAHGYRRRGAGPGTGSVNLTKIFPWFILWFLAAALLNTAGLFGPPVAHWSSLAGKFLVVMVMAAVGLSADLRRMREIGLRPFYIGLAASVIIAAASLALIRVLEA
ncbi:MAG: putative sulfate exporter family transporter [Armatimonadota bacterium]|nr:putative sulfate exporter family transporter [Armatimonadota bacterium]